MAKILDEYKPIVTEGRKIVSALGIDLSTHNHAEHLQKLANKTLEGSLNVRDVMYLTLANKGLKIPKESKGFVADSNLKFLREAFPFNSNAPFAPTGTGPSPQPNTFMKDWTELTNQLKKNNESLDTLWKDVATPEAQTKYNLDREFTEPPARAKALRQGAFAIDTQAALIGSTKRPTDVKDATTGRRLYLDDRGLTSILGGSRVFTQKKRLEGKGLSGDYGPENVRQTFSAFQKGLKNVDNKDVKAAILLNSIIPFRAKNITNLRMNEAPGGQYAYLSEDGSTIKIPDEGQKVGQKRYVDVKLTPHLQAVLTEIRDANTDANGNPTREYLFRPKGQKADAFNKEVGKALKGVAKATKSMADEGILDRPIANFKDLRKISYLNMVVMPGNTGLALSNIAGHSTKLSDAKLTQQFNISDIGVRAYAGRGARKTIEKPLTPTELIQLVERNIVEGAGLRDRRDISSVIFNVPFKLAGYADTADPDVLGAEAAKQALQTPTETRSEFKSRIRLAYPDQSEDILETFKSQQDLDNAFNTYKKITGVSGDLSTESNLSNFVDNVKSVLSQSEQAASVTYAQQPEAASPAMQKANADETLQKQLASLNIETPSSPDTEVSETLSNSERMRRSGSRLAKAAVKKIPAVLGGGITLAASAIEESFAATPTAFSTLDPVEGIIGTPTSELSDAELFERMQDAASQRLSPDMAERTTALADIEANREGFVERVFDAPSRMKAEQANLTELDYTTPELERMRLAKTLQDVDIDASEIDSMEAIEARKAATVNERIQRAKIAAEAAEDFNKRGEGKPLTIDIYNTYDGAPLEERFK